MDKQGHGRLREPRRPRTSPVDYIARRLCSRSRQTSGCSLDPNSGEFGYGIEDYVMRSCTYLVFGDLHGRILPAFRLASAWAREHQTPLDGVLQVGDLGFFPDPS